MVQGSGSPRGNVPESCQQAAAAPERTQPAAGRAPSYFHSLSPFMGMLLEQVLVPVEEEKLQEVSVRGRELETKGKGRCFGHFHGRGAASI